MRSILTIAGSDPSGGAGIEADLSVFAAYGVHARTAITALTVQSLNSGIAVHATPSDVLEKILNAHERDALPDVVKIGMIATRANLDVICDFLERHPKIPVVLDPVLRATSGLELLEASAVPQLKERLWPRATIVTPNLDEVGVLIGHRPTTVSEMESAAKELRQGNQVVMVKGGHLAGDPVDVVWDGVSLTHLESPRVKTSVLRGTGCRLASAMACELAGGMSVECAIQNAKQWLVDHLS